MEIQKAQTRYFQIRRVYQRNDAFNSIYAEKEYTYSLVSSRFLPGGKGINRET